MRAFSKVIQVQAYVLDTYEKVRIWAKTAGLRSIIYLVAAFAALILLGSQLLFGVGVGIFCADNWTVIKELIQSKFVIKDPVDNDINDTLV